VQNRSGLSWRLNEINKRLKERMMTEAEKVWSFAQEFDISLRNAAYAQAIARLGEALDAKGTRDYYQNKTRA
jgi:glutamate dehydrogenase (NADP+)